MCSPANWNVVCGPLLAISATFLLIRWEESHRHVNSRHGGRGTLTPVPEASQAAASDYLFPRNCKASEVQPAPRRDLDLSGCKDRPPRWYGEDLWELACEWDRDGPGWPWSEGLTSADATRQLSAFSAVAGRGSRYWTCLSQSSSLVYGLLNHAPSSWRNSRALLLPMNSCSISSALPVGPLISTFFKIAIMYSSRNSAFPTRRLADSESSAVSGWRKLKTRSSLRMKALARDCKSGELATFCGVKLA